MDRWRQLIGISVALLLLVATALLIYAAWVNRFDPVLTDLVLTNFPAIIGLPFAFIAAFIVVTLFRQSENPIEFKFIGMELKGPAGEVVLWILCFIAIVGAIALLWIEY